MVRSIAVMIATAARVVASIEPGSSSSGISVARCERGPSPRWSRHPIAIARSPRGARSERRGRAAAATAVHCRARVRRQFAQAPVVAQRPQRAVAAPPPRRARAAGGDSDHERSRARRAAPAQVSAQPGPVAVRCALQEEVDGNRRVGRARSRASSAAIVSSATATPAALSEAPGDVADRPSSSSATAATSSPIDGTSWSTSIAVPRAAAVTGDRDHDEPQQRDRQPAQPPEGQPAADARAPQHRGDRAGGGAIDKARPPRVVVGGDEQPRRVRRPAGVERDHVLTRALGREPPAERASGRGVGRDRGHGTSASRPPIRGSPTIRTLAPTPRAACHACASAQFGRHQKVSIVAARPWFRRRSDSHSAARRSASLPPRRPVNEQIRGGLGRPSSGR